jgi:hypothetical protein
MFTLKSSKLNFNARAAHATVAIDYRTEKAAFLAALFLLAFGLGLIADGKRLSARQQKLAQKIDYKSTLNPFSN